MDTSSAAEYAQGRAGLLQGQGSLPAQTAVQLPAQAPKHAAARPPLGLRPSSSLKGTGNVLDESRSARASLTGPDGAALQTIGSGFKAPVDEPGARCSEPGTIWSDLG
jgi:hypothetical protein